MSDAGAPLLEYAPRLPMRWRKLVRRLALVLVLLAASGAGWRWGPQQWRRMQEYRRQRKCMTYTAAPERIVYEEDPKCAENLLSGNLEYRRGRALNGGAAVAMFVPAWLPADPNASGFHEALLFMHERTSPAGKRRLVKVWCDPSWEPAESMPGYFHWEIEQPVSPWAWASAEDVPLEELLTAIEEIPTGRLSSPPEQISHIRFFAGQADPADFSHFSIKYELNDAAGMIDGWLTDEQSQWHSEGEQSPKSVAVVRFRVRSGPAARNVP
jgi:hypothetical protein